MMPADTSEWFGMISFTDSSGRPYSSCDPLPCRRSTQPCDFTCFTTSRYFCGFGITLV